MIKLLREGGLKFPSKVGQTLSVVGGIIIGDAAIKAKVVSADTLLVVAIVVISTFVIPNYEMALEIRLLRFPLLIFANMFGALGTIVGYFLIIVHLCSLESFGIPYLSFCRSDMKDIFIRKSMWMMNKRPQSISNTNPDRQTDFRNKFNGDDIGRINQVIFYSILILIFVPISAIKSGSILNLQPVFQSDFINILKASKESVFAYSGIEAIFLLYPHLVDVKQLKKCAIKSILFILTVYVWDIFITIFYFGIDIISKFLWPTIHVTEALRLPVVNNFKAVFSFLWTLILIKTLGNYYFATAFVISDEIARRSTVSKALPYIVMLNLITITILCLMIAFKRDESK